MPELMEEGEWFAGRVADQEPGMRRSKKRHIFPADGGPPCFVDVRDFPGPPDNFWDVPVRYQLQKRGDQVWAINIRLDAEEEDAPAAVTPESIEADYLELRRELQAHQITVLPSHATGLIRHHSEGHFAAVILFLDPLERQLDVPWRRNFQYQRRRGETEEELMCRAVGRARQLWLPQGGLLEPYRKAVGLRLEAWAGSARAAAGGHHAAIARLQHLIREAQLGMESPLLKDRDSITKLFLRVQENNKALVAEHRAAAKASLAEKLTAAQLRDLRERSDANAKECLLAAVLGALVTGSLSLLAKALRLEIAVLLEMEETHRGEINDLAAEYSAPEERRGEDSGRDGPAKATRPLKRPHGAAAAAASSAQPAAAKAPRLGSTQLPDSGPALDRDSAGAGTSADALDSSIVLLTCPSPVSGAPPQALPHAGKRPTAEALGPPPAVGDLRPAPQKSKLVFPAARIPSKPLTWPPPKDNLWQKVKGLRPERLCEVVPVPWAGSDNEQAAHLLTCALDGTTLLAAEALRKAARPQAVYDRFLRVRRKAVAEALRQMSLLGSAYVQGLGHLRDICAKAMKLQSEPNGRQIDFSADDSGKPLEFFRFLTGGGAEIVSELACPKCGWAGERKEPFLSASLGPTSLADQLSEQTTGGRWWGKRCGECEGSRLALRSVRTLAPAVLVGVELFGGQAFRSAENTSQPCRQILEELPESISLGEEAHNLRGVIFHAQGNHFVLALPRPAAQWAVYDGAQVQKIQPLRADSLAACFPTLAIYSPEF